MARGWPRSIIEFRKVNASLADPTKHIGASKDAFHSVCPVLPGYGFSSEPGEDWFGVETAGRVEQAGAVFGLRHKFAQGGDWGSAATTAIGMQALCNCSRFTLVCRLRLRLRKL